MSHYKIKCVYCLKTIEPDDVAFDEADIISQLTVVMQEQSTEQEKKAEPTGNGSAMQQMGKDRRKKGTVDLSRNSEQSNNKHKIVTGSEIRNGDDTAVSLYNDDFQVRTENKSEELVDGDLIEGYNIKTGWKIGSVTYKGKFRCENKYCPYCHKLLLKDAGKIPTYIIDMIGHSSAGKTVYLTIQNFLMNINKFNLNVPYGEIFINFEQSHLSQANDDSIYYFATNFRREGKFPPTTQAIPNPHCFKISYRLDSWKQKNLASCILCFKDIIGELYTIEMNQKNLDNDERLRTLISYVKQADGFLLITDPEAFDITQKGVDAKKDENIERMIKNLNKIFDDNPHLEQLPSVCMMTKQDEICNYVQARSGVFSNFSTANAVVADGMDMTYGKEKDENWAEEKFFKLSEDTKECIQSITNNTLWSALLAQHFYNATYIPISSIGPNCKIISTFGIQTDSDDKSSGEKILVTKEEFEAFESCNSDEEKIQFINEHINTEERQIPINQMKARFVEQPLFYFIDRFHIIPPVHDKESYVQYDEVIKRGFLRRDRIFHTKFSEDVLNEWINDYAQVNVPEEYRPKP